MNGRVLAVILVLLTTLGLGIGYYATMNHGAMPITTSSTSTKSTSISSSTTASSSTTSSISTATTLTSTRSMSTNTTGTGQQGLQLIVSLGPSTVSTGENVTVHMRAFNRAPTSLALNASEIIDPFEAPCGLGVRALGLDVYPGHYTLGNLSTAPAPLMLYNASVVPSCPVAFVYRYTFQPESSTASVEAFSSNSTVDATYAVSLGGYWVNCCSPGPGPSYSYVKFQPGQYTVVVFDAWDQRAVESFIVS